MDFLKTRHPFIQLLMLFGVLGVGMVVSSALMLMLVEPLTGVNVFSMEKTAIETPAQINAWRIMFALNSVGIFMIPSILFALLYDRPALGQIGFRSSTVRNLLVGAALLTISLPFINTLSVWNKAIHLPASMKALEDSFRNMSKEYEAQISKIINMPDALSLFLNIIVMALLPAIAEEFFFRGCMQQIFQQWFKNYFVAALVTATIFSIAHFDFYGFFPRVALGFLLGWLFAQTGSLWPGIIAHFVNNGMAIVFSYVSQHAHLKKDYGNGDLDIPVWTGIVSLLAVIYLVTKLKRDHSFDYSRKEDILFRKQDQ